MELLTDLRSMKRGKSDPWIETRVGAIRGEPGKNVPDGKSPQTQTALNKGRRAKQLRCAGTKREGSSAQYRCIVTLSSKSITTSKRDASCPAEAKVLFVCGIMTR
jgi:hypothetical protein